MGQGTHSLVARHRPRIDRRPVKHSYAAIAVLFCIVALGEYFRWGGVTGVHWWSDGGWTISAVIATISCARTARRTRGHNRAVWILFTLACASWLFGQMAWNYFDAVPTGFPPPPTFIDVGDLGFVPAIVAGLLLIARGDGRSRTLLLLDLGIVASALTVLFLAAFGNDLHHAGISMVGKATSLSYPILYGTLSLSIFLIPVRHWWRNSSIRLLFFGLLAEVIPFILWTPAILNQTFTEGSLLDVIWMLGMLLIAASADSFADFPPFEAESQVFGTMSAVPLVMGACVALIRLWSLTGGGFDRTIEIVYGRSMVGMMLLTIARLALTLRGGRHLLVQVRSAKVAAEELAQNARQSEARFRAIFDHAPIGIEIADMEGNLVEANRAAELMLGYGPGELNGIHWTEISHPDAVETEEHLDQLLVRGEIEQYDIEKQQVRRDGSLVWTRQTVSEVWGASGPEFGIAMVEDITDRRAANEALQEREASFRLLFADNPHPMWVFDPITLRFLEVNGAAIKQYGYSREEFLNMTIMDIRPPETVPDVLRAVANHKVQAVTTGHFKHLLKDGQQIDVEIATHSTHFAGRAAVLVLAQDVTKRKSFEDQLKHQALHDGLTSLPNRTLMRDRLEQAILAARRDGNPVALLLMDLDGFKDVNDTYGHHVGDALLQQVGPRLRSSIQESDTVARLGGDEFAVILPATDLEGSTSVASRIKKLFREPFTVEDRCLYVDASIGIALYPDHGLDAGMLLRHADVAMYAAKRADDDTGFALYAPDHDLQTREKVALTTALRDAIDQGHLQLHYQPKVGLADGCYEHVEALVRWELPERGLIPPDEFIPLAEETGLIRPLTVWVLREALHQCSEWHRAGIDMSVAVNLSPRNLSDADFPRQLQNMLTFFGVPPAALIIEITESTLMADPAQSLVLLSEIHDMGVQVAIDDFGTGYSSLAYLKELPVDEIKIDRSFVADMRDNDSDHTIVRSVVDLGHNLGLQVIAEGVENSETCELLTSMGCDMAQGYFFGRPMPVTELQGWIDQRRVNSDHHHGTSVRVLGTA